MKSTLISMVLLIVPVLVYSQDTLYFDGYFRTAQNTRTDNYRTYTISDDNTLVKDFNQDRIYLDGTISGSKNIEILNEFMWYIRTNLSMFNYRPYFTGFQGSFVFCKDSNTTFKTMYDGQNLIYYSILDSLGNQYLANGTGEYIHESIEFKGEIEHLTFEDSILVDHFSVRPVKGDTIYNFYHQMAEPKGGFQSFYDLLAKKLKYPFF